MPSRQPQQARSPAFPAKTAEMNQRRRQIDEGKAADGRNKSIDFVQQIHWNRSTKSMESLNEINGFVS